ACRFGFGDEPLPPAASPPVATEPKQPEVPVDVSLSDSSADATLTPATTAEEVGSAQETETFAFEFITMVGKAGVSPREHQDLGGHATYGLTPRYSHSRPYDLAAAVQTLPIPTATRPEPEVLSATGTDGQRCPDCLHRHLLHR